MNSFLRQFIGFDESFGADSLDTTLFNDKTRRLRTLDMFIICRSHIGKRRQMKNMPHKETRFENVTRINNIMFEST